MSRSITVSILFLFVSLTVMSQDVSTRIDSLLKSIHNETPEVSIGVGLVSKGITHFYNYGNISRDENAIPLTKSSVWEIASITKALTGNLLAQAVLEGKVKLEDYIDTYLPETYELPINIRNTIRISDLASHQSGLSDIDFPALIAANSQQPTAALLPSDIVEMVNNCDSLLDYGKYRYSTLGLVLIGQILEEAYGTSYEELFEQKIKSTLILQETKLSQFDEESIVAGYNPNGGKQEAFEYSFVGPAGLVKSSTSDMVTYLKSILAEGNTISEAAKLQENTFFKDDNIEIGLAVNILRLEEDTIIAKTGDTMGHSSVMAYDRENQLGLVIFINQQNGKLRNRIFNELYELIYVQ